MPDNTKPIEDKREAQTSRLRYAPPLVMDLGELPSGQGKPAPGCGPGAADATSCDTGTSYCPG